MPSSFARNMVRYRTWLVAFGNAGVTWIVLIIAPLGLFAVIICTLLVFVASLGIGTLCDRVLSLLIDKGAQQNLGIEPNVDRRQVQPEPQREDNYDFSLPKHGTQKRLSDDNDKR